MGFLIIFNSNWGKDEPTILHHAIMKNVPWTLTLDRFGFFIGNLTPADVYLGRGETILAERRRIKHKTIQNRRLNHHRKAA
jgi:hypothetical protein